MTETLSEQLTIFHVTHWKAGSQWLYRILQKIAPERIISPQLNGKQFMNNGVVHGAIYPTVYVTREQFHSVALPEDFRKFVVIRDLRDTLISGYFSIRYSHAIIDKRLARWRQNLMTMTIEDGLLMLMDEWLPSSANIQKSWITAGEQFIRYEDLLVNDTKILEDLLIGYCCIPVTSASLQEAIEANRFENLTGGRKPGEENVYAHERKGVPGDWRIHFTPRIAERFDKEYSELLSNAGYLAGSS